MRITSCHNCQDRVVGCHSICERYLNQVKANAEQKKRLEDAMRVDAEFKSIRAKQKTRTIRKKQQEGK